MIIRDLFKEEIKGKSMTRCGCSTFPSFTPELVNLPDKQEKEKEWRNLLSSRKTDLGKYIAKQQRQVVFITDFHPQSFIG